MGISRIDFGSDTLMDLTEDTVSPENLLSGTTAHNAAGNPILGTAIQGHIITDDDGISMPVRSKLKFENVDVSDDSENDMTIVTSHGSGSNITITTEEPTLFGKPVTISKDSTVLTKDFSMSGSVTFTNVSMTGTITITSTDGTDTAIKELDVPYFGNYTTYINFIPNGSTILPTDDIQIWLKCAGIDKSYTTLSEVLADHDTLYLLMGNDNAVDYLVRSKTWATNNNVKLIPKMTSDTAPSGVASFKDGAYAADRKAYKAFDRNPGHAMSANAASNLTNQEDDYIQYQFASEVKIGGGLIQWVSASPSIIFKTLMIDASTDGINFTEIYRSDIEDGTLDYSFTTIPTSATHIRCHQINGRWGGGDQRMILDQLQFFEPYGIPNNETAMKYIGKWNYASDTLLNDPTWHEAIVSSDYMRLVLNVEVPQMTSNTTPSGVVSASSVHSSSAAWKGFSDNGTWHSADSSSSTVNQWLQYEFTKPVCIKAFFVKPHSANNITYKIQGYNTVNSSWDDLTDVLSALASTEYLVKLNNYNKYTKYRLYVITSTYLTGGKYYTVITRLNFYGRTNVTENVIDIYSAAGDAVMITPQSGSVIICETDTTGHGIVARNDMPAGTYTLSSIIAKNPSNLSNDYTKTVTITASTSEVYFMPDGALYWWGYMDSTRLETCSTANGWGSLFGTAPTYQPTYIDLYAGSSASTSYCGVGLKNAISTETKTCVVYTGITGSTASGITTPFYLSQSVFSSKSSSSSTGTTQRFNGSGLTYKETEIPSSYSGYYLTLAASYPSGGSRIRSNLHALWIE